MEVGSGQWVKFEPGDSLEGSLIRCSEIDNLCQPWSFLLSKVVAQKGRWLPSQVMSPHQLQCNHLVHTNSTKEGVK